MREILRVENIISTVLSEYWVVTLTKITKNVGDRFEVKNCPVPN